MVDNKQPDYVSHQPSLLQMLFSSVVLDRPAGHEEGQDWFGVWWVSDPDTPGLLAVDSTKPHVLDDIEDWEDIITWPDLEALDWEAAVKTDLPDGKDLSRVLCAFMVSGPFERLHDLLGFEEALVATIISPDACEAFFSKLCDFKIQIIRKLKQYYDIDMLHFQDDWGTQNDLFFQPDFWRTRIKPHVQRVIDVCKELGVLFDMHSCGRVDLIVDEIIDMGVDIIDPVQPVNDLPRWKQDFGDRVIFMGALDAQGVIDRDDKTQEDIVNEVHEKIDLFATDGYFIPFSVALTPRVMDALDEAFIYGRTFYGNDYQDQVDAFLRGDKAVQETTFLATE
jgi:uroporphyrinogen decarboxylase